MLTRSLMASACIAVWLAGCGSEGGPSVSGEGPAPAVAPLTRSLAMDPASCAGCHAAQYDAWSTSMHANAADDPLFVAMNARAQRDTAGAIGGFCVSCHAPLALRSGATTDGRNLADLPAELRGVTCFFCHSVGEVTGAHDDALTLAQDGVMRGPIADPAAGAPHGARYSSLHDRSQVESASLCGACHDVRTPSGLDVERTYAEWSSTVFAHGGAGAKTCGNCHMAETTGNAADVPGAPLRPVHDHAMVGLDVPLSVATPSTEATSAVQSRLDPALDAQLCVTRAGSVDVTLTNTRIGHAWPSGAAHDRRAWVELVAYEGANVVYRSGVVAPGSGVAGVDPPALSFQQTLFGPGDVRPVPCVPAASAGPAGCSGAVPPRVLFLWQASFARSAVLPPTTTLDPNAPGFDHAVTAHYAIPAGADRVTTRVLVTPVAPEVVDALVAGGDLDPAVAATIPQYTLVGTHLEWTSDRGFACLP